VDSESEMSSVYDIPPTRKRGGKRKSLAGEDDDDEKPKKGNNKVCRNVEMNLFNPTVTALTWNDFLQESDIGQGSA
jgi:hypothetical protein